MEVVAAGLLLYDTMDIYAKWNPDSFFGNFQLNIQIWNSCQTLNFLQNTYALGRWQTNRLLN